MVADRDVGSATPIVVAVLAVIVIVGLAAVDGGAVIVASAKNESAADLAALAAARVDRDLRAENASSGSALHAGCEAAREVASQNGVAMTSCLRGPGASVDVAVELRARGWPLPLRAASRAGPAWG
jgi:secretion/DNA translocation related TadE-like protein